MKGEKTFATRSDARNAGWFSRRHMDSEPNREAREAYQNRQLRKEREHNERIEERSKRSNEEQIALLDARLGVGVGAVKERARLNG